MSTVVVPECMYCKHYIPRSSPWKCAAFPEEIPDDIICSRVRHISPYPGDHGIQFEVIEDEREEYEELVRDRMSDR